MTNIKNDNMGNTQAGNVKVILVAFGKRSRDV